MIDVYVDKMQTTRTNLADEIRIVCRLMSVTLPGPYLKRPPSKYEVTTLQIQYDPTIDEARNAAVDELVRAIKEYGPVYFPDAGMTLDDFGQVTAVNTESNLRIRMHWTLTHLTILVLVARPTTKIVSLQNA